MKKYDNVMLINIDKTENKRLLYKCGYKFDRLDHIIEIYKTGVCIHAFIGTEYDIWDLAGNSKDVNDALRKAYLLYALCVGKGLLIRSIRILRNEKEIRYIKREDDIAFPFVYLFNARKNNSDKDRGQDGKRRHLRQSRDIGSFRKEQKKRRSE